MEREQTDQMGCLVSIITVSFNSEATISTTIESVLRQSYCNMEYLIVDGNSTDGTVKTAENYRLAFQKKGIRYTVLSEPDRGIYDAMNKGIRRSTGDLVGIINSDDWYEPDAVLKMAELYKKTKFDLAFADIRMVRPDGRSFVKHARRRKYVTSRDWNHPTQFVARRVYDKYLYRCRDISDDMDFYFRTIREGYHIEICPGVLANFRLGGVSSRIPARDIVPRIKRRYRIYRENGFGRGYMMECIAFETAKFLLTR